MMVLVNLSKIVRFAAVVHAMPVEVPKRISRLTHMYYEIDTKSSVTVSMKVRGDLERIVERHLDNEDQLRQAKIIECLIKIFTENKLDISLHREFKIILLPSVTKCLMPGCFAIELSLSVPRNTDAHVSVYTTNGVVLGELYHRKCQKCSATYYNCYWEFTNNDGILTRSYYDEDDSDYFSITSKTVFEKRLLDNLAEEIITCNVQFTNWVECYNRVNNIEDYPMSVKLIIPAWLLYMVTKKCSISFPVERSEHRNLDEEKVFAYVYPKYRQAVDQTWISHSCSACSSRIVILDGDAKVSYNMSFCQNEKMALTQPISPKFIQ